MSEAESTEASMQDNAEADEEDNVRGREQPEPPQIYITSPWDGDLDLQDKTGKMLWKEGIEPLTSKFTGYGKDLNRFLADFKNRADKCRWNSILMIKGKHLVKRYGEIQLDEVKEARELRNQAPVTSHTTARPKINALMMYYFLYDSLGPLPIKKLSTKLDEIAQDGPVLLKMVLDQTFVATMAATFVIKEKFYDLQLRRYKWNVQAMNQDIREKMADLEAAGHASDETDVIISLFRAYSTSTNDEFKSSVGFWKNEWTSGTIRNAEQLMAKADSKYSELRDMGTWGKRGAKDDQILALTAKVEELEKRGSKKKKDKKENSNSKWKYDKSLSSSDTLVRNGKTYKWCKGPGHGGIPMWVIHEPGSCTKGSKSGSSNSNGFDQQAFVTKLKTDNIPDDEIDSKLEAIMAIIES